LGTDSAPHEKGQKECCTPKAGVYTGAKIAEYAATLFEGAGCLDHLANFTSHFGRKFYRVETGCNKYITITRKESQVPKEYSFTAKDGQEQKVVPFMSGQPLSWSLQE
jgi:dihydroorotase